jgi:hypothetical protein
VFLHLPVCKEARRRGSWRVRFVRPELVAVGRLTDELGHDVQLNDAYMRAVELLTRIEGED